MQFKRTAGILLPVSSLPSPHGIGTLGGCARTFVDFLSAAGQTYWQVLPVGPTSYGDSPYQSFSTFAGNPYFIDLEQLEAEGLLTAEEIARYDWGGDPRRVDYAALYQSRFPLLELAFKRGHSQDCREQETFAAANQAWLPNYARFMALKRRFGMLPWNEWPEALPPEAELETDICFFTWLQFVFDRQWRALKQYANGKGISMIGDLPIYVAMDSADLCACPECFRLGENHMPAVVAGVPPDGFTDAGQLWGNPLYDWERMQADGFRWWEQRLRATLDRFDAVRLDHFRGFESYWVVPYGDKTAARGHWEKGPGRTFVDMLHRVFPDTLIIAEDLGYITDEVRSLVEYSGFPSMKVLEFAFDQREAGDYLPHFYPENSVCYAGTHDNATICGWLDEADPADVAAAKRYFGLNEEEGWHWGFLRGGMASAARIFIAQMQDYLGLGAEARMNAPGTLGGNWQWRILPDETPPELAETIREFTLRYGRLAAGGK